MELPVRMEMDDAGNHRVVAHGQKGDWVKYEQISSLDTPRGLFIAATLYYKGVLPCGVVLAVKPNWEAKMVSVSGIRPD